MHSWGINCGAHLLGALKKAETYRQKVPNIQSISFIMPLVMVSPVKAATGHTSSINQYVKLEAPHSPLPRRPKTHTSSPPSPPHSPRSYDRFHQIISIYIFWKQLRYISSEKRQQQSRALMGKLCLGSQKVACTQNLK